jgi:hypothetical protein
MHPESDPAYLADCASEFIAALNEARELAAAGAIGAPFNETLRFCSDLLDILTDASERPDSASWVAVLVGAFRARLDAVSAQATRPATLHDALVRRSNDAPAPRPLPVIIGARLANVEGAAIDARCSDRIPAARVRDLRPTGNANVSNIQPRAVGTQRPARAGGGDERALHAAGIPHRPRRVQ